MQGYIGKGAYNHHVSIDHAEYAIRNGNAYTALTSSILGLNVVNNIVITTPVDPRFAMSYTVTAVFEMSIAVYRGGTYTGGTEVLVRNRDIALNGDSTLIVKQGITIVDPGILHGPAVTYGVGKKAGAELFDVGFLLAPGNTLRFMITSLTASNNIVTRLNFLAER